MQTALSVARSRLEGFVQSPIKHTRYAIKVLIKYKLLEFQTIQEGDFMAWVHGTPYFETVRRQWFADTPMAAWVSGYVDELVHSGAARREDTWLINA